MVGVIMTVGTSVLSGLINMVINRAIEKVQDGWVGSRSELKNALRNLQVTLSITKGIIMNVEKRVYYDDNTGIHAWLESLQEATYDADDVLDELEYERLRTRIKESSYVTRYLCKYDPIRRFEHDIVAKINTIQDRLDRLLKLATYFKLEVVADQLISSMSYTSNSQGRTTTSYFENDIEICGREHVRDDIVKYFIANSPTTNHDHGIGSSTTKVPILHIVGMGGIGKTTLARMVYNDEKIKNNFNLRIWICVSDDFSELKIISEILEHIYCTTGKSIEDIRNNRNLNTLTDKLQEELKGKTYFLVLDDVWNEDSSKWERIEKHFRIERGFERRRILVTTRSDIVANTMSSAKKISLNSLEKEIFFPLFKKCAFGTMDKYPPTLEKMGNDIAQKLMGSPLAAKTVGRILRSNLSERHWDYILKSELWSLPQKENDIMPALRLSYQHLPEHLKPCFAFCALYPKDYKYKRSEIVNMWIALGYIQTRDTWISMEEIGDEYVDELLDRRMFQSDVLIVKEALFQSDVLSVEDAFKKKKVAHVVNKTSFTMHDLIHDLAKMVSANDSMMIQDTCRLQQIPSSIRHLSVFTNDLDWIGDHCFDHVNNLRTVILEYKHWSGCRMHTLLEILGSKLKLKFLRILNIKISNISSNDKVKTPLSKSKHLRYVNLNSDYIHMLPSSLTKLYQLQRLDGCAVYSWNKFSIRSVCSCEMWKPEKPESYLLRMVPDRMDTLIKSMAEIRKLPGWYGLEGLHLMKGMRELSIHGLHKVKSKKQALQAKLNTLHALTELSLIWSGGHSMGVNHEKVFDGLELGPKVAVLRIIGYGGKSCPEWMENLKFLQNLFFCGCRELPFIPTERLGRIKILETHNCPRLRIQPGFQGFSDLHSLEVLVVSDCPLLLEDLLTEGTSRGLPSSLKELDIRDWEEDLLDDERTINVSSKILQSLTNLTRLDIVCRRRLMPPSDTNQPNIQQQLQQLKWVSLDCGTAEQLKGWLLHLHGCKSLTHLKWICRQHVSFDAEMREALASFVSLKSHDYDDIFEETVADGEADDISETELEACQSNVLRRS